VQEILGGVDSITSQTLLGTCGSLSVMVYERLPPEATGFGDAVTLTVIVEPATAAEAVGTATSGKSNTPIAAKARAVLESPGIMENINFFS
jgi:hypothetical protein